MNSDGYDVVAKAEGNPLPDQLFAMVRRLLEDWFKLVTHRDTRDMPVFALMTVSPDGSGAGLRRSTADCAASPSGNSRPVTTPRCGILSNVGEVRGTGAALAQLASSLSPFVGRIVRDQTGLTGPFDFEIHFTPDEIPMALRGTPGVASVDPNGPSLFTALREQLGLRLEATTGPVDVLVVDRVERPTDD